MREKSKNRGQIVIQPNYKVHQFIQILEVKGLVVFVFQMGSFEASLSSRDVAFYVIFAVRRGIFMREKSKKLGKIVIQPNYRVHQLIQILEVKGLVVFVFQKGSFEASLSSRDVAF